MDKYLLGIIITGIFLSSALFIIPIQDAESYLAIPPQRAFSIFLSDVFGVNVTANLSQDALTFTGGDITFFPDNNTIDFGSNVTELFTLVNGTFGFNKTHVSLGGDADVFKDETVMINLRGISEDNPIEVTERSTDILIGLEDCDDAELYIFNTVTDNFECKSAQSITITFGLDNTERLYSHLAKGTAGDNTFTFGVPPTEYEIRFHEFTDGTGMGASDEYASWYSVAQLGFNSSANMEFSFYYTTEKVGNAEPFCLQVDIWEFVAEGGDLDATVGVTKAFCDYTPPTPDILEKAVFVFTGAEHNIDPGDFIILNLGRFGESNATDTGDYKVYTSDPEIRWNIP